MEQKRKAIRAQLQQLLKYETNESEKPELLFRLAENYFEEATAYFYKAQRLDDKLAADPTNERLRREVEQQKKQLRKQEDAWKLKAVALYRQVAEKYPNYPGRDQVLFYLGYTLWDMQRYEDALKSYRELIRNYPKSKFVPDAYLAFGEYYFEQAKLDRALMAYKKAAEYKDAEIYPYALYKQGWCYYNLHEWEKAMDMFKQVVYLADMEEGTTGKRIEIRKEALKDFTLTYSQSEGSATRAPRVFKALAPKEAHKLLVSLAGMYFGSGQDQKALLLYTYLIKNSGCSADVPFFQGRVVDCASRLGNKRYTIKQVRKLVALFKKTAKCLKNPDKKQKQKLKEARELAELTLRKLASTWYKEAKETKQRTTFEYAQEMFGDYLELFPDSPDAYDMRFAYAELLFHRLNRYERAAVEYAKVVEHDVRWLKKHKRFPKGKGKKGRSPAGTYLCDAAYKSVLAQREIMKKTKADARRAREAEKRKAKDKLAPLTIPKLRRRFIRAAEVYLKYCPRDQDICSVKFDIAKTYYDYNHFDVAVKRFDEVVEQCTSEDLAEYAANLVLDAFNLKQDWDSLNKYARKYYSNRVLMKNQKLKEFLEKLIPQIAFKRITMLEKQPKFRKMGATRRHYLIGKAYVRFVKEFGTHDLADEALFNASVEFERAERLDLARKAREKLIEKYPKSDLVPGTIFNLAENYERMTNFGRAAELYELYARTYKKMKGLGRAEILPSRRKRGKRRRRGRRGRLGKKASARKKEKRFEGNRRTWNSEDTQAALMNAGIYREALHQFNKAIADRLEYVELFPNSPDAPQVFYSLGLLYERMKKYRKAAEVYGEYARRYFSRNLDRAIAAHMKRAEMLLKLRRWKEAEREMLTTISLYRKHSRRRKKKKPLLEAAEAAAHAQFILGEREYKDYIKYRFTTTKPKKLARQLKEKTRRLEKVKKIYTAIAKLKQPEWAIASLYKLGRAYENFAETFYRAPLPKGLTPEQKDIYMQMLREKGQPFEDKAVAHFEMAVKKGSELGFYSMFTRLALKKLQHYRSAQYPREDLGFRVSLVAESAIRNPLLVAAWDEVKKKPELLYKEPPLRFKKVAEIAAGGKAQVRDTAQKARAKGAHEEQTSKAEKTASGAESSAGAEPAGSEQAAGKASGGPGEVQPPPDPASEIDEEEPDDEFE